MPIGIGFDIHRLIEGKRLILGGVSFEADKAAEGHSDGDVVLHALTDAMLGASGLGDIGMHFPDYDMKYKNIPSKYFVQETLKLISNKYRIVNIDINIILEKPKLGNKKLIIKENISKLLRIKSNQVNVKAKSMEGLGEIGENRAIMAQVVIELKKK